MWNSKTYLDWVRDELEVNYRLSDFYSLSLGEPQLSFGVLAREIERKGLPFCRTLHCLNRGAPPTPYAHTLRISIDEKLVAGISYLLTFWSRSLVEKYAQVAYAIEHSVEPFTKLIWHEENLGPGWRQFWFRFEAPQDFEPGECRFQLLLQNRAQEIELGGLCVLAVAGLPRESSPEPHRDGGSSQRGTRKNQAANKELDTRFSAEGKLRHLSLPKEFVSSVSYRFKTPSKTVTIPLGGHLRKNQHLVLVASFRSLGDHEGVATIELFGENGPLSTSHHPVGLEWSTVTVKFPVKYDVGPSAAELLIRLRGELTEFEIERLAVATLEQAEQPKAKILASPSPKRDFNLEPRQSVLGVRVLYADGEPVCNAEIEVKQTGHAFGLGTAVRTELLWGDSHETYQEKLFNLTGSGPTFNRLCPEWRLSWNGWESSSTDEREQLKRNVRDFYKRGFTVKGHYLASGSFTHLPPEAYFHRLDKTVLESLLEKRLYQVFTEIGLNDAIREWDIFNEPFSVPELISTLGQESVVSLFRKAALLQPEGIFCINENCLLDVGGLAPNVIRSIRSLMERLRDQTDCRLSLGLQGHFRTYLPTSEQLEQVLTQLSAPGWDLRITEFDINGVPELVAADFFDNFLSLLMRTTDVKGLDIWGFWDGASWCDNALLFRKDWSLKPAGEIYLQRFFSDWWTKLKRSTGTDGVVELSVYQGRHELNVSVDSQKIEKIITVDKKEQNLEIVLPVSG